MVDSKTASSAGSDTAKENDAADALQQRLLQVQARLQDIDLNPQQQLDAKALASQINEGDVKGRRPAKTKPQEQAEFDARRGLKGMKPEEALKRLELLAQRLATEAVS